MRKSLIILILTTMRLSSCGQPSTSALDKDATTQETKDSTKEDYAQPSLPANFGNYLDTEFNYVDSRGEGIIIQNSYPKGGIAVNGERGYTDPRGRRFGYGQFWTRMVNETSTPIEINISFPADSFAFSPSPDTYFKLLLPQDKMSLDKLSLYNYGVNLADLNDFLDSNFDKATYLKRTIKPQEDCLFYVTLLIHLPNNGPIRAGFVMEEKGLIYRINIDGWGSKEIPCGELVFKEAEGE